MQFSIGPWLIECDVEKTRAAYVTVEDGAAHGCQCDGCDNFHNVRAEHFSPALKKLLFDMGADPDKEISVRRVAPLDAGSSLYAGSFAISGRLLEGPGHEKIDTARLDVFEQLDRDTHLAIRHWRKPPEPWREQDCLRLRFLMVLPWCAEADPSAPIDLDGCKGPVDRTLL